jgi:hypothetical protein
MASFSGTNSSKTGTILVFIKSGYYNPISATSLQGTNPIIDSLIVNGAINAASINVSGSASFGSLSVTNSVTIGGGLSVAGGLKVSGMTTVENLSIGGHLVSVSKTPQVSIGVAAGQSGQATISGTDLAGTITIQVQTKLLTSQQISQGIAPEILTAGALANVTFTSKFSYSPRVVISPDNANSVNLPVYVTKTKKGYSLIVTAPLKSGATYQFDYIVIGSKGIGTG